MRAVGSTSAVENVALRGETIPRWAVRQRVPLIVIMRKGLLEVANDALPHVGGVPDRIVSSGTNSSGVRRENANYWRAITRLDAGVPVTKACWGFHDPAIKYRTPPSGGCSLGQ